MPNKLTDAEIKKALEICTSEHLGCEDGCPLDGMNCGDEIPKLALDLINRQEAEIAVSQRRIATLEKLAEHRKKAVFERVERNLELRKDLETANADNENLKAEVERLKEELKESLIENAELLKCKFSADDVAQNIIRAKAEAYKECLEKIEQRDVSESDFYIMVKKTEFDNLLNELVGDADA